VELGFTLYNEDAVNERRLITNRSRNFGRRNMILGEELQLYAGYTDGGREEGWEPASLFCRDVSYVMYCCV
jgi:hypothetical protein